MDENKSMTRNESLSNSKDTKSWKLELKCQNLFPIEFLPPSTILEDFYLEDSLVETEKCTQEQSARLSLLQKGCQTLQSGNPEENPDILRNRVSGFSKFSHHLAQFPDVLHFWFNKPRGLTLCTPHKVGSQTWRYFFQRLEVQDKNGGEVSQEEYYLSSWPTNIGHYHKAFQVRY